MLFSATVPVPGDSTCGNFTNRVEYRAGLLASGNSLNSGNNAARNPSALLWIDVALRQTAQKKAAVPNGSASDVAVVARFKHDSCLIDPRPVFAVD